MMGIAEPLSLSQLNQRIAALFSRAPELHNVWVTAETSDVRSTGGHCYLELIEKDPRTGAPLAKIRANIWASTYRMIAAKFYKETGQIFTSDLKVMLLVSASYHPFYGLSLNVCDINSAYTLGDAMQRRNQMIQQLQAAGIINNNRALPWPRVPQRIAIISAKGAAGYGDFINQLYHNSSHLRFHTRLFPAVLQGENTAPTIIAALEQIATDTVEWDCVVIIRGGGATTDLMAFDNYDLAANIACFPLPVIIGIGHERDITLLDYVANRRVKTPTAAAEWLIEQGENALTQLQQMATAMLQTVTARLSGCHQQLAYISGQLPAAAANAVHRACSRLDNARLSLATIADRRLRPELMKLDNYAASLSQGLAVAIAQARQGLDAKAQLVEVLSPMATLRRGYSITRVAGHCISSVEQASAGEVVETLLSDGTLLTQVMQKIKGEESNNSPL